MEASKYRTPIFLSDKEYVTFISLCFNAKTTASEVLTNAAKKFIKENKEEVEIKNQLKLW